MRFEMPARPEHEWWQRATAWLRGRAEQVSADAERLRELLQKAGERLTRHRHAFEGLFDDVSALIRMLSAWLKGQYPLPKRTVVAAAVAFLYFVMPFDFIPDFIPILGMTDDVAVLGAALRFIGKDLDAFRAWEEGMPPRG